MHGSGRDDEEREDVMTRLKGALLASALLLMGGSVSAENGVKPTDPWRKLKVHRSELLPVGLSAMWDH